MPKYLSMRTRRGFTLLELLVVISIIGIASLVLLLNISKARNSAKDAKRKFDLKQFSTGFGLFANEKGTFPQSDDSARLLSAVECVSLGINNYVPNCPPASDLSQQYYYQTTNNGQSFCVWSEMSLNDDCYRICSGGDTGNFPKTSGICFPGTIGGVPVPTPVGGFPTSGPSPTSTSIIVPTQTPIPLPTTTPTVSSPTITPTTTVSSPTSTVTPIATPTITSTLVLSSTAGCGVVNSSWNQVANESGVSTLYTLSRCPNTQASCTATMYTTLLGNQNVFNFSDSSVTNGQVYTYRVRARFPDSTLATDYETLIPSCP